MIGQRRIPAHEHTPLILQRDRDRIIAEGIDGSVQQPEVDQSFVQLFHDIARVAAGDVAVDIRAFLLQVTGGAGDEPHDAGLSGADVYISGDGVI